MGDQRILHVRLSLILLLMCRICGIEIVSQLFLVSLLANVAQSTGDKSDIYSWELYMFGEPNVTLKAQNYWYCKLSNDKMPLPPPPPPSIARFPCTFLTRLQWTCIGGNKSVRSIDEMLDALRFDADEKPRLVHRLDRVCIGTVSRIAIGCWRHGIGLLYVYGAFYGRYQGVVSNQCVGIGGCEWKIRAVFDWKLKWRKM